MQMPSLSKHAARLLRQTAVRQTRRGQVRMKTSDRKDGNTLQGELLQLSSVCHPPLPSPTLLTPPTPAASTLRRAHNKAPPVHGASTCAHSLTWRFAILSEDLTKSVRSWL